ncbi:hypothetical protein BSKO_05562 [Bryopsis sp. KO-2023]|nr:hypothetical protein BSKO_05562 [Bryopsis sp. KO-2023]
MEFEGPSGSSINSRREMPESQERTNDQNQGVSHQKTQEVLRKGKQELQALKDCIEKVKSNTASSHDWRSSISRVPTYAPQWSPEPSLEKAPAMESSESETTGTSETSVPSEKGEEEGEPCPEQAESGPDVSSTWERIVTWVAGDSPVGGNPEESTSGRSDHGGGLEVTNKRGKNEKEPPGGSDFDSRIQAVAKREAEALLAKVTAEQRMNELDERLRDAMERLNRNEHDPERLRLKENDALLKVEQDKNLKLKAALETIKNQNAELQGKCEGAEADLHDAQDEVDSLSRQLKLSESSRTGMKSTLDRAQEEVADMQKEVQVMKVHHFEHQHQDMKKAAAETESLRKALISLAGSITAGLRDVSSKGLKDAQALETALGRVEASIDEVDPELVADVTNLSGKGLSAVFRIVEESQDECLRLKAEVAKMKSLHQESTEKLNQEELASRKLAAYASEIDEVLSEVHRMSTGMEDLRRQVRERDQSISGLETAKKMLELEMKECKKQLEKAASVESQCAAQESKIVELERKLMEASREVSSLKKTLDTKEDRIRELRLAFTSATDADLKEAKQELERVSMDLEQALKDVKSERAAKRELEGKMVKSQADALAVNDQLLSSAQRRAEKNQRENTALWDTLKVLMREMKEGVSIAQDQVHACMTSLRDKCACCVDASSISAPLKDASHIAELWLSGDAAIEPPELIKSHLAPLIAHSMKWCIDCLTSELHALDESQQEAVKETKEVKLRCQTARKQLEKALRIGQLQARRSNPDFEGSACGEESGADSEGDACLAMDADLGELAELVVRHVNGLAWVVECGDAELGSLKEQVQKLESAKGACESTVKELHAQLEESKSEAVELEKRLVESEGGLTHRAVTLQKEVASALRQIKETKMEASTMVEEARRENSERLESKAQELEAELEELKKIARAAESQADELQKANINLGQTVEHLEMEKKALSEQIVERVDQKDVVSKKVVELEGSNQELESELSVARNEIKKMKSEMSPSKFVSAIQMARIALVKRRRRALFADAHHHKVLSKKHQYAAEKVRDQLRTVRRELQTACEKAKKDSEELTAATGKVQRLEVLIPKLEERRRSQEDEKKKLQEKLKETDTELTTLNSQVLQQVNRIDQYEMDNEKLASELDSEATRVQDLSAKLVEAKAQLEKMVNLLVTLQGEHASTLKELETLKGVLQKATQHETEHQVRVLMDRLELVESEAHEAVQAKIDAITEKEIIHKELEKVNAEFKLVKKESELALDSIQGNVLPLAVSQREANLLEHSGKSNTSLSSIRTLHSVVEHPGTPSGGQFQINPLIEMRRQQNGIENRPAVESSGTQTSKGSFISMEEKAIECALLKPDDKEKADECQDAKTTRLQELRGALARVMAEKDEVAKKLQDANTNLASVKANHDSSDLDLNNMAEKHKHMESNIFSIMESMSETKLHEVLGENSAIKHIVLDEIPTFDQVCSESDIGTMSKLESMVGGFLECLIAIDRMVVDERAETKLSVGNLVSMMDANLAVHERQVRGTLDGLEERVSKGSRMVESVRGLIDEVKGQLEESRVAESVRTAEKQESSQLKVDRENLLEAARELREKLTEVAREKEEAIGQANRCYTECQELAEELREVQCRLERAAEHEEDKVNVIANLETKGCELSEALQDSEARLDQSDHLIEELKSRLVESIAQSEGKDEQVSHLKLGLNTALEKIRILQEDDRPLSRQGRTLSRTNVGRSCPASPMRSLDLSDTDGKSKEENQQEICHSCCELESRCSELQDKVKSLESERDELSHRCECLAQEIKTARREAKESQEAAEELDSKAEALSEQLANVSIASARDRSDSLIDQFKREIRAKAEMIDELMVQKKKAEESSAQSRDTANKLQDESVKASHRIRNLESELQTTQNKVQTLKEDLQHAKDTTHQDDSSAISESFASECMEGPKNGLPNMERIVNLWKSACDARQLRVSELEKSVSDLKANKKKEIKEVQLELESKQDEVLTLRKEISSVKSENDKAIMEANDLRVELVMARRAIDSKDAELSDGLDRLARHDEEVVNFRREVERMSGDLEKAEKESKCAKKELDEVQSQAKATKEQMQEFEDALQATLDELNVSIGIFQEALVPTPETSDCSAVKNQSRKGVAGSLKEAAQKLRKCSVRVQKRLQQVEIQTGSAANEIEDLVKQLQAQTAEAKRADHDCKCLMEVCEKQSRDAHRYQEKCCALEKDLDEVQAVVDHWKSEVNRKESEITKLSEEMDSFSRRSEELGALVAGKTAECAKAIREVEHAHQELKTAKEKNAVLGRKVSEQRQLLTVTASECENAKKDREEVISQIRSLKEELESSHFNADTLEENLSRKSMEIRELNHMLKAWEAMRVGKDAQISALIERCRRLEHPRKSKSSRAPETESELCSEQGSDWGSELPLQTSSKFSSKGMV